MLGASKCYCFWSHRWILSYISSLLYWSRLIYFLSFTILKNKSSIKITNKFAVFEHKVGRSILILNPNYIKIIDVLILIEYVDLIDNFVIIFYSEFFYQLFLSIELIWSSVTTEFQNFITICCIFIWDLIWFFPYF